MEVQRREDEFDSIDEFVWDDETQSKYVRSISKAGGSGGFAIGLPVDDARENNLDTSNRLLVVPGDLAGQLGIQQDPIFEVYELPLEQ